MGNSARTTQEGAVRAVVGPVVEALGLDLEDIDVQAAGKRRRVNVVVDRDGGIDLDGIAEASRAVSDALDGSDVMGDDRYTLEVSSPGIDRPLTLPRHWRRNVTRRVRAHFADGTTADARITGTDDDAVLLAVDTPAGAESQEVRIGYPELVRGDVQIEFRRPEKDPIDADQEEP
jgi:ribosome maturation factor RimP